MGCFRKQGVGLNATWVKVLPADEHSVTLIAANYSDPLDFDTWLCLSLLPPFFNPFLTIPR
jgi:hypothetical protein